MIAAIDALYVEGKAKVVCIEFAEWKSKESSQTHFLEMESAEDYLPGEFYKRELPCILKVLELTDLSKVETIVVDGYVILDDNGKHGLGGYLFEKLNGQIPVIGVAKRSYFGNTKNVIEIIRGESKNPLFITSIGMENAVAAHQIKNMSGNFRIPDLLKYLDRKTKEKNFGK